jgi:hypothetical protein
MNVGPTTTKTEGCKILFWCCGCCRGKLFFVFFSLDFVGTTGNLDPSFGKGSVGKGIVLLTVRWGLEIIMVLMIQFSLVKGKGIRIVHVNELTTECVRIITLSSLQGESS